MKKFNLFLLALFSVVLSVPLSAYGEDTALITSVDQLSSTATKSGDFGVDNLIDGDASTYWRTADGSELGASYFQVELPYSCGSLYFVFTRRGSSDDHCITEWGVYGVPADNPNAEKDDCVKLAYMYTDFGEKGETLTSDVFDSQGYTTLRFYVENINNTEVDDKGYYAHVAEFQLYEVETYARNDYGGLILSVDQLSSPYTKQSINEGYESEGELYSLIDNDPSTYWHLENSSSYPGYTSELGVQYLQVKLLNSYGMLQVVFTRRNGYADYQITRMSVYAVPSEDAEKADCIYLGDLDLPFTAEGETLTAVFDSQGYTTLRFYIEETTTGSTSTHIAEFQLYEYTDMNLAGRTITVAQTADASMKPGQWYVALNRWQHQANNFMRDPGVGANLIMSDGTDVVYSGMDATAAAQYMVRFVSADAESGDLHPKYYMQYGTGNYLSVSDDKCFPSVSIQELADPVYVYNASVYGGEYYVTISTTDDDSRLDNYGAGGAVIKGDPGEADDASYLDDVYFLFPVSVSYDRSEFKTEDGGLITSVDQLSSPYTRANNGSHDYSLASMIDGDTSTYWCSETSGTPMGTQYFQVELPFSCDWLYFVFTRRGSNDVDCITEWGVYGVPADNPDAEKADCVQLAYLSTPHGSKGETLTSDVFDSQGYTTLRFYVENTTDPEDGYTHIAEFQLYEFADVSNKKIASISDAITTQPEVGKWYLIMNNRGGTMTPAGDTGAGESITRASSADAVTAGMAAEGVAGYLLSFFPTGESSSAGVGDVCTLRWATGNYWASIYGYSDGTAITTTSDASAAGVYNVYPTATGGSTFGLNAYDMNKIVDNNGAGGALTGWGSGQNTATSGNNVWWLYEVEFADMNAEELQLAALIKEAEADYALYDGKLDTGFSTGDGVGNGLIKSTNQFSSPYTDPTEGSLSNLLDNDAGTYWHSTWHNGDVADGTHYLQVDMTDDFNGGDVVLNLIRRNSNNDHVTAMSVKDGNDVEIVPAFEIPFSGSGATDQVSITIPAGYKTLRFYEQATTSNEGFWHVGDFQLFDASYIHPDYNNTNPEVASQLTAAIAAANEAMTGTVSQADIDALQAAIDYYLDNIDPYKLDPGTVVHECVAEIGDWTTTGNNGTHEVNTWSDEADESGMVFPFCQNWVWEGDDKSVTLTSATISHNKLEELKAGYYLVNIDIRIFSESGADITSGTTLSANGEAVDLVAAGTAATYGDAKEVYGGYTMATSVTNGTLDISMNIPEGVSYNWIAWKNLSVTYYGDELPAIAAAEGMMNSSVEAAMTAALAAYEAENTPSNYNAAIAATHAAEKSAEYYAGITAVVSGLDEAGTAAWEASSDGEAYAALTLNGEDISATLMEACKAQTTPGADLTYVMTATSWTGQTGTYADGVERFGDEIEVEGEPVKVLYQSITGMLAGTYEVSFYGVANNAWVGAKFGTGIAQAFANDETEDIDVYDQTACTPTDYPHTFATVEVGLDGMLEYGLQNIATGGNWYVCQAISLTLVELAEIVEPVETAPYEFVCAEWGSIDTGRVSDENVTYDETANTIIVNAGTGLNNVALSNGRVAPFTTENYTISEDQCYFVVKAADVSTESGASMLWWMNGSNGPDGGMLAEPDKTYTFKDGQVMFIWDVSDLLVAEDGVVTLNGWTGFGLTSTTGTSVVSEINFYTHDEVIATGISGLAADVADVENNAIYTVSGVRISNMKQPGVYIVNGKKIMVK